MTTCCRNNFTYSFIVVLSLHCTGFSLVVVNSGYSVVAVCGLLIAVASRVAEHRLQRAWTSVVAPPGL